MADAGNAIAKNKVVSIDYTLTNDAGEVIDSSKGREPLTYLHGAGNIIPGLERALEGKSAGDQVTTTVAPGDGYGQKNPGLVQPVPGFARRAGAIGGSAGLPRHPRHPAAARHPADEQRRAVAAGTRTLGHPRTP